MKAFFYIFLFFLFLTPLASAQTVSVGDYSTVVDSNITVPINISDAESIAGVVVNISFDPSIVSIKEVNACDFGTLMPNINNSKGWVKIVAARIDAVNKNQTVLANIVFNGSSNGTSALTIEYASLNNETGALLTTLISNGKIVVSLSSDDTSPPSPIRDLVSDNGSSWINWTWTNPSDPDFNHTELYLNGTFLTNIPASQNYYNITGLLPDTPYELSTRTVDTSGNINFTWVNDTASTLPISATTLNLYTGWNLISLPLMPEDTSITSLLSSINGNYSIIWEYNASDTTDHWKKYDPGVPFGNDLTNIEPGKGYWIMMTSDDTLPISGTVPESTDLDLKTSWNLVGFNSLDSKPIAEALSSINGNYSIVWAYNTSDTTDHWKKYDPDVPFGNDLINMEPGRGYWIMMTSEGILKI